MNKRPEHAVGIDLGTTCSVVAYCGADGRPMTVTNAEGELTTPSVVYFHDSAVVVGKEAVKAASHEPDRIAQFAKRDMGKSVYHRAIGGQSFPPEVIQALVLSKLRADAELQVSDVRSAVITVPAYFNEPRRKATQDAGKLAGIDVIDIINEPTAAAIAFGLQQGFLTDRGEAVEREVVLVYDLGGGTFDATLMELYGHNYTALATAGDVHLGGIDWDQRIVDHLALKFQTEHRVDLREDPFGLQMLRSEAEDAKKALTSRPDTTVHLAVEGRRTRVNITRERFAEMTEDLVGRTVFTVQKVLKEARLGWPDVSRLLLVGGSSRMPMIREALESESGMTVDRSLSPDEAVAHGAAIYASLLTCDDDSPRPQMQVTNVNSHDLGVLARETATGRQRRQILIKRNSSLPASGLRNFVTARENQKSVAVNVVEGGDASGHHATHIGKCVVRNLPPGLGIGTKITVRFSYAANGRLKVDASIPSADRKASLTIERTSGLSDEMLALWRKRIADQTLISAESVETAPLESAPEVPDDFDDLAEPEELIDLDEGSSEPAPLLGEAEEGDFDDQDDEERLPPPEPLDRDDDDSALDDFLKRFNG